MKNFAQQIRERRQALGLTQKAVAERIGTTPAYISILESGKSLPPPRPMTESLAHALKLDPEKLWQVALEERKQRFLQKAHGRLTPAAPAKSALNLERLPSRLRPLINQLQKNPELLEACEKLQALYEAGGEPWTILQRLIAHYAEFPKGH